MADNIGQQIANTAGNIITANVAGIPGGDIVDLPGGGLSGLLLDPNGVNSLLSGVTTITIDQFPTFNQKNYAYMLYLMQRNIQQYRWKRDSAGVGSYIGGDGDIVPSVVPSYAAEMNYADFANQVNANEKWGVDSTQATSESTNDTVNLYPNDNGSPEIGDTWNLSGKTDPLMRNSILYKTKKLFEQSKINTIISRFGTSADGAPDDNCPKGGISYNGQSRTRFGESHGRNLLKKEAETSGVVYDVNGYNNPYCRVWTHHHQYDSYEKVMRPLSPEQNKDFQQWNKLFTPNTKGKFGWKSDRQSGWEHSVLNHGTGFLNIAPSYNGGGTKNIHTKQCMFSIENLAWKGYDPYSFEQALSWEQRGPLGGRIMWFPPYGIHFSETTNTDWNRETFIGRGEEVFTYKNTKRTGTLNFMLVVDHPSSLDYATWYDSDRYGNNFNDSANSFIGFNGNGLSDNDIHRYFAGCDTDTVNNAVKPTPLTDEGVNGDGTQNDKPVPESVADAPGSESDHNPMEISFYVFYPNNYSGAYDMPQNDTEKISTNGVISEEPCHVEAIAYLLGGIGVQMKTEVSNGKITQTYDSEMKFSHVLPDSARGYEMAYAGGISDGTYIVGNKENWNIDSGHSYTPDETKKWYYRIDGCYEYPKSNAEVNRNTFDQYLKIDANYKDSNTFRLNLKIDEVKKHTDFCSDTENLYSLAEVVFALMRTYDIDDYDDTWYDYLKEKLALNTDTDEEDRISYLTSMFLMYNLEEITCEGYSNTHGGVNPLHVQRNEELAESRALTIQEFIKSTLLFTPKTRVNTKTAKSESGPNEDTLPQDSNDVKAKLWRSAKCTLKFKSEETKDVLDTNQGSDTEDKSTSYNPSGTTEDGLTVYKNESGQLFVKQGDEYVSYEKYKASISDGGVTTRALTKFDINDDNTVNKVRYDQEYHFFKQLEQKDKFTYNQLLETIKYFNPAYHSMTPEGFNARLTFLNQCMRQGDTTTASDRSLGRTANNLAFGSPPFCVLRLGDFFNQLIAIDSINITYLQADGTVWDLNAEGAGVQPMLAEVALSFSFIGGADIAGPVRRLQNAMTFNYYANTSLYDNRADRVVYTGDPLTMGGADKGKPDYTDEAYYTHTVDMYKKDDDTK